MDQGIYFKAETNEAVSVASGEQAPSDGWLKLSDEPGLGLVAVRGLLLERELVDERRALDVYWRLAPPGPQPPISNAA